MFILLLTSMLTIALKIQPVNASGIIYIMADGSIDPPSCPIQREGDLYILTGNISSDLDGIVINRPDIVFEGSGFTIQGTKAPSIPVTLMTEGKGHRGIGVETDNATVRNVNLKGFDVGIIFDATYADTLLDNSVTDCTFGISLSWCTEITLSRNSLVNNTYGLDITGGGLAHSIDTSNLVDGKPVYYLKNQRDLVITSETYPKIGYLGVVGGLNITVKNLNISGSGQGLFFAYTNDSRVVDNNFTGNEVGISTSNSFNNNISGNLITGGPYGVWLFWSPNATLSENTLNCTYNFYIEVRRLDEFLDSIDVSNVAYGKPVYYFTNQENLVITPEAYPSIGFLAFVNCSNISVSNVSLSHNSIGLILAFTNNSRVTRTVMETNEVGMRLLWGFNNTISENEMTTDDRALGETGGFAIYRSSLNTLCQNCITSKTIGIFIYGSSNNKILGNSLLNNDGPVVVSSVENSVDTWDDGYPSGGNYWSDYNGTDRYGGLYQNETGRDGVGDTPYVINANNIDHYPLMGPWTKTGENVTVIHGCGVCLTFSNVTSNGITTVDESQIGPNSPLGFKFANEPPVYYDIKTTANYSGSLIVSMPYNDTGLTLVDEINLRLMHWNSTSQLWDDITTRVDTGNNVMYGVVDSLSKFAIFARLLGDINYDATVDIYDAILLSNAFNSQPGNPNWNANADINGDNIIDLYDAIILSSHYNQHYP